MKPIVLVLLALGGVLAAGPALAYVGPGPGLSLLGALWGVLVAVVVAVSFVILWPMRRLLRRRRQNAQATTYTKGDVSSAGGASARDGGARRT